MVKEAPPWHSINTVWRSPKEHEYDNNFVQILCFYCHENQNSAWIENNWRNLGEDIERMPHMKLYPYWPSSYRRSHLEPRIFKRTCNVQFAMTSAWLTSVDRAKNCKKADDSKNIISSKLWSATIKTQCKLIVLLPSW